MITSQHHKIRGVLLISVSTCHAEGGSSTLDSGHHDERLNYMIRSIRLRTAEGF